MAKRPTDLDDVMFIIDELNRFSTMGVEDFKAHYEEHPEDIFCDLPEADGRGFRAMGRLASRRFGDIAKRAIERDPSGHAIGLESLVGALKNLFLRTFRDHPVEQRWVSRMINQAKRAAVQDHRDLTHYFPCVLVRIEDPPEFQLGPVRFLTTNKFIEEFSEKIRADFHAARTTPPPSVGTKTVPDLEHEQTLAHFKPFLWTAEVKIPACDPDVSRGRAEAAALAALDILRIPFGPYGKHFRLAFDPAPATRVARLTRSTDGAFHFGFVWDGEGAHAENGWFENLSKAWDVWLKVAAAAVDGHINPGLVSRHRDRWLDALNWYGQAMVEQRPAAALVKFVAALERLTSSGVEGKEDIAERVARRTGLLCSDDNAKSQAVMDETREIYRWRSKLMHGSVSPASSAIWPVLRTTHRVVPLALQGALQIFWTLSAKGEEKSTDLERVYITLEQSFYEATTPTMPSDVPNPIHKPKESGK